jgi:hypothetical protein
MNKITLRTQNVLISAEMIDNGVSREILANLPLRSTVNTWGEEIYFSVPLPDMPDEEGTTDVEIGDLAFWPEGSCLCVFFGRTPASTNDKPVPASRVILLGKIREGLEDIRGMTEGEEITVETS